MRIYCVTWYDVASDRFMVLVCKWSLLVDLVQAICADDMLQIDTVSMRQV